VTWVNLGIIDLLEAMVEKLKRNGEKYPVEKAKGGVRSTTSCDLRSARRLQSESPKAGK